MFKRMHSAVLDKENKRRVTCAPITSPSPLIISWCFDVLMVCLLAVRKNHWHTLNLYQFIIPCIRVPWQCRPTTLNTDWSYEYSESKEIFHTTSQRWIFHDKYSISSMFQIAWSVAFPSSWFGISYLTDLHQSAHSTCLLNVEHLGLIHNH